MSFELFAKKLLRNGYQPIPVLDKVPRVENWHTIHINEELLDQWATQAGQWLENHEKMLRRKGKLMTRPRLIDVGVRHTLAVDVDIYHQALSEDVQEKIREMIGPYTRRYGQRPKFLVPSQSPDIVKKMLSAGFRVPGEDALSRIEVLAGGQQWVAMGFHSDANTEYKWETDKGAIPFHKTRPEDLPVFTAAMVLELFAWFEARAVELGLEVAVKASKGNNMGVPLTPEQAALAVRSQPAEISSSDEFDRKGMEIIKELLEEEGWAFDHEGVLGLPDAQEGTVNTRALYFTRPGKIDGVSASLFQSPDTGAWLFKSWSTSVDVVEPGITRPISFVWAAYKHKGYSPKANADFAKMGFLGSRKSATEDFADMVPTDILAKFLERFVLISEGPKVADLYLPPDRAVMKMAEWATTYAPLAPKRKGAPDIFKLWMDHPQRLTVRDVKYDPTKERTFTDSRGVLYFNTFIMPTWHPTTLQDRVDVPLEHFKYLLEDGYAYYMGWLAHIITKPGERPSVTPLLISVNHGTGRGWVDELIKKTVGIWNCAATTMDALAGLGKDGGFTEYMHETIFCTVPEAKGSKKHQYEIDDAVRDKLTSPHQQLNLKYGNKGFMEVYTAFSMASNHRQVVRLDPVDRRMFVAECLNPPRDPAYYNRLYAWLEDPENLRQFYWWLHRYREANQWDPKAPAPMTRAKAAMCNVLAETDEESAVVSLKLNEALPAVADFGTIKVRVLDYMRRMAEPGEEHMVTLRGKHLQHVLAKLLITGNTNDAFKCPSGRKGKAYILREDKKWEHAPKAELYAEMKRWEDFPIDFDGEFGNLAELARKHEDKGAGVVR